jgi:hypothetical protein
MRAVSIFMTVTYSKGRNTVNHGPPWRDTRSRPPAWSTPDAVERSTNSSRNGRPATPLGFCAADWKAISGAAAPCYNRSLNARETTSPGRANMNEDLTSDSNSLLIPHTQHESVRTTPVASRPFGSGTRLLPVDLVTQLLERERRYDPQLAYSLAVIAGWAYSDGQTLANKLKFYGLPAVTVEKFVVTNPAMLIVSSAFFIRSECGRIGILAFRGTEPANAINWLTDTDVIQRAFGDGFVHQGFYANLQAVWDEISAKLYEAIETPGNGNGHERARAPMQRLYITGHSLGAAMAVLAAAKISLDETAALRQRVHSVYTFGQPAVGDKRFAAQCEDLFGDRLYRHVYGYDVVPHLPPTWDGRFHHFGEERVTAKATEPWVKPSTPLEPARWIVSAIGSCVLSFVARRLPVLEHFQFPYSLDDHSPTRYIEASRSSLIGR